MQGRIVIALILAIACLYVLARFPDELRAMGREEPEVTDQAVRRDYSLVGRDAKLAVEKGLATAEWYRSPVPRQRLKELMQRRDGRRSATR
jgi:hypothetical protein